MATNDLAGNGRTDNERIRGTDVDVGVIGVAATRTVDPPLPPRSSWLAMEDYVALIDDRTPMYAVALPLSHGGVATVASAITGHPAPLSADSSSAWPQRSPPRYNAGSRKPQGRWSSQRSTW